MKKNIIKGLIASATLLPARVLAATDTTAPTAIKVPGGGPSIDQILGGVINILLWVAGVASVIVIIVGGIMYIVSGGNEKTTKTAKDAILYAVIGLVITILAFAIVRFVLTNLP